MGILEPGSLQFAAKILVFWVLIAGLDPMALYFLICRAEDGTEPSFICERVCTSDRLMRRMGSLSKVGANWHKFLNPRRHMPASPLNFYILYLLCYRKLPLTHVSQYVASQASF